MGIGLALTLGDAPIFSASLALGIIFVSLVSAVPFFWQTIVIRQRLVGQLLRVPPAWHYLMVGASLLLPVLAFYGLVTAGVFWILPFAMLLEALLVLGVFATRRKVSAPGQVSSWRAQSARARAGWLAGVFAFILPLLPMLASAVGILTLPVSFANVLDSARLGYDASVGLTVNLLANNTLIYAAGVFIGLLLLAGLAIGLYLLLLALRLAASKKRL